MKLSRFPIATAVRTPICLLSILVAGGSLFAAPAKPETFHLPLAFEENRGQAPPDVKWMGQGSSYRVLLGSEGATFLLPDKKDERAIAKRRLPIDRSFRMKYSLVRMKLAGGRLWKNIAGAEPTGGVSNYLNQTDLKSWISNVPQYQRVKVASVYNGIDLIFYTNGIDFEYDFVIAPGADPKQIQVVFEGVSGIRVDPKSGDLVLTAPDGSELRQRRPKVYQHIANKRVEIAGGYRLLGQGRAAFTLAAYDRNRNLIIDPTVDFTTFYGGSSGDEPYAITVDDDGNSYITGGTGSTNFPTTNGSQFQDCQPFAPFPLGGFCSSPDTFVVKLDPTGKVVFASYGGVGWGNAITIDSTGVYVTGENLPADGDNIIASDNDDGDTFVWRLEAKGGLQNYFKVFAAEGTDFGSAIGLDSFHNVWIAGAVYSGDGSVDPSTGDADIFEVAPDGSFLHDFRFRSNKEDVALGIAIDAADHVWATGKTCGDGFPTTDGVVHEMNHCGVFVLELDRSGFEMLGMILGGGDGDDEGVAITPNGGDDAFVTGTVSSTNFPSTQGAFQTVKTAGPQGFVAQVDSARPGGLLVRSTFFGADGTTTPYAIVNKDTGGLYVTGATSSVNLPGGPVLTPNPTAGFVTKFSLDLSQVRYTQLLGLVVSGIALRKTGPVIPELYTTGWRYTGGHDYDHEDAFVVKLDESTPVSTVASLPPQVSGPSFTVSWGGSDPASDIASYDVFVSVDGEPFTPFLTNTTATSATFTGVPGHFYGFFSIATDTAGRTEPMKTAADVVVMVATTAPPKILCTGCYFVNNGVRATLAFNVSLPGSGSTFNFSTRNGTQALQFVSTTVSQISATVSGFATFSGEGTLNGQPGYTFEVGVTDGGPVGSGLDTILVQIFGPNNFTYNAPATIAGGDIVVHQ